MHLRVAENQRRLRRCQLWIVKPTQRCAIRSAGPLPRLIIVQRLRLLGARRRAVELGRLLLLRAMSIVTAAPCRGVRKVIHTAARSTRIQALYSMLRMQEATMLLGSVMQFRGNRLLRLCLEFRMNSGAHCMRLHL